MIFPSVNDWVHDKTTGLILNNKKLRKRPDYRSDKLKLIIEYDGLPHYQKPDIILKDYSDTKLYERFGYKVVRIPYFIQLTRSSVKQIFDVDCDFELFSENVPSLNIESCNTPAYLCNAGIIRMANEFRLFPEQYQVNIEYLKSLNNEYLTGALLLEREYSSNL